MRRHLYHSLQRFLFDECYKIPVQNDSGNDSGSGAPTVIKNSLSVVLSSIIVIMFGYLI